MTLTPVLDSSQVAIDTGLDSIGALQLWVPEAICTNTGISAVCPVGRWSGGKTSLTQSISGEATIGPGNAPKVDENHFEIAGIRVRADSAVEWTTAVECSDESVNFSIQLTNFGPTPMVKAGAAICLKFLDAPWWSDDTVFAHCGDNNKSLQELGRDAGRDNGFQAYLVGGHTYDHVFYREFWGINPSQRRQIGDSQPPSDGWFQCDNRG